MKRKSFIISIALVLCVTIALVGVLAACKDTQNDSVFSSGKLAVQKDGLWGYVDTDGKMVIQPQYDMATPFIGNYFLAAVGSRNVLIDKDGNEVMELGGDIADINEDFTRLAAQEKYTGKMGVIDTENAEWVVKPIYDDILFTEGGLMMVSMGSAYGLLAADGTQLYPVEYSLQEGMNAIALTRETADGTEAVFVNPSTGAEITKVTMENINVGYLPSSGTGNEYKTLYYSYTDENNNTVQVIPGNETVYNSSTASVIGAYGNILIVAERADGTATGTYDLQKPDGTSVIKREFTSGHNYFSALQVLVFTESDGEGNDVYWTADILTGTVKQCDPAVLVRAADGGLWIRDIENNKLVDFNGNSADMVYEPAEGETLAAIIKAGTFVTVRYGIYELKSEGAAAVTYPVGSEFLGASADGAYYFLSNREGYLALYRADGSAVFGYDAEITDMAIATL